MSNGSTKLSFAFGGTPKPPAPAVSMSNMEMLLAKAKSAPKPPPKPAAALFNDEDDDHPSASSPSLAGPSKPKPSVKQNSTISRAERKAQADALKVDASVFDYDSVYDKMKAAERQLEEMKKEDADSRKPKYIENFLASAQTRRLDKLRAEEKMLQLEREKEGDEFEDKEKFVTEAYKKQMVEVRKSEEEEKIREDALRKSKKGPGLTSLYKSMLDDNAAKHDAAVAATSSSSAGPSLAIRPPTRDEYEPEAEYDPFLAREAAAGTTETSEKTGKEVEINDDGEVVDKRSLLKAGLNIMKKPKTELPNSLLTSQRSGTTLEGPYKSRAVGTAASYQERMERERRRLADQVKEDAEKKRRDEEQKVKDEDEAARKRREGDDGEAERKRVEARERFLARKRAREEEKAEGKKKPKEE